MKWMKLGDIATYINGYAFKPTQWATKGKPIIRIQNLNNENAEYNYYDSEIDEKYIINNGDILISWSASIGAYIWNRGEAILNQHIFKVDFNKIEINKNYFKYMVDIALLFSLKHMHGSTMKHLTKKVFEDIKIPVPSMEEQEKIATLLTEAQNLIDKRKEQIDLMDKLKESIFYEMFGDPVKNEKNWNVKKLNDISDVRDGTHDSPKYVQEGFPLITSKNLKDGYINYEAVNLISKKDYDAINKRSKVDTGDILMPMIGTIGNPIIVTDKVEFAIKNVALIKFNKSKEILNVFIRELFNSSYFERVIKNNKRGGTQKFISLGNIRNLDIPVPPLSLQNEFAEKVEAIEEQKKLLEKSLGLMEDNYNALMQKAFK